MGLRSWRLIDHNGHLFVVAHDVCGELLEQLQADLTRRVHLDKLEDAEAALGVLPTWRFATAEPDNQATKIFGL